MKKRLASLLTCSCAIIAVLQSASAQGQSPAVLPPATNDPATGPASTDTTSGADRVTQSTTSVAEPPDSRVSGEIIVTAQRRSQPLEQVPAAVTAVSADQLANSGVVKFMDIAQIAAGVQIQKNGYTTQPSVRGVTSLTTGVGFENNTALYVDGFYQPDSVAINADLANISQIEILKGPQGTLYGRNATAGAILIATREPADTFSGEARVTYQRFDDRQLQGWPCQSNVAGPLGGC